MWPTPKAAFLLLWAHSLLVSGSPVEIEARQSSCPGVHVFGARETTVSPGFGTAGTVVNLILREYPGSTSEAISYPACGGQSSCGGVQYGDSARQGTNNAASQVNTFHARCPNTQIVLVGYSQVSPSRPFHCARPTRLFSRLKHAITCRAAKSSTTPTAAVPTPARPSPPLPRSSTRRPSPKSRPSS